MFRSCSLWQWAHMRRAVAVIDYAESDSRPAREATLGRRDRRGRHRLSAAPTDEDRYWNAGAGAAAQPEEGNATGSLTPRRAWPERAHGLRRIEDLAKGPAIAL